MQEQLQPWVPPEGVFFDVESSRKAPPCCSPPAGPPQQAVFAGEAESAGQARRYAHEVVTHYAPGITCDRVDDVQLIVSEMATNAIRYGGEGDMFAVGLIASPERVRIEVHDTARQHPRLNLKLSSGGRGLHVIDSLAAQWGVKDQPCGKIVWAELTWT